MANGFVAPNSNTMGANNPADGTGALYHNTTINGVSGQNNTATGLGALFSNTTGSFNDAVGAHALFSNVDGFSNNALGESALNSNISGDNNTAVGHQALLNSTGDFNTALGADTGMDPGIGSNNIYIGDAGFAGDNNVIAIGGIAASGTNYTACFIGGIYGASVSVNAAPVYIDTDGHLGTVVGGAKPSAAPLLRGKGAQHQAVLDRKVENLQATAAQQHEQIAQQQEQISQQQRQIQILTVQLKEQGAQIQKVSAQLEVTKPAPQVVLGNQ